MSQFIVKSPEVFIELQNTLKLFCEKTPILVGKANELLINLRETFYVDLQETIAQISQNQEAEKAATENKGQENKNAGDGNNLQQKQQQLVSSIAHLDMMIAKLKSKNSTIQTMSSESRKGITALGEFYSIASSYLSMSANNSSSSAINNVENTGGKLPSLNLIGDSLHFNSENKSDLNQFKIDELLRDSSTFNHGTKKAGKLSIANVSQLNFSLLEKNGFTIQQIKPNSYSAFKNI
jgi:hypothetical protein